MRIKEVLEPNRYKIILFVGLSLYAVLSDFLIRLSELIGFFMYLLSIDIQHSSILMKSLTVLDWAITICVFYILTGLIVFLYDKISVKSPRVQKFFQFSREKIIIMYVIFILFVITSSLSHLFWGSGIIGTIFSTMSAILGTDDVTIVHSLFRGNPNWHYHLPSIILSIFWWYLISSAILYFKKPKYAIEVNLH